VNRKNINDIIKLALPFSSAIIGAPRKAAEMAEYVKGNTTGGTIEYFKLERENINSPELPSFFKAHEVVLQHEDFIAGLNDTRVWGTSGAVIAAGDYFISDVSREFNKGLGIEHSIYYTIKQVIARRLKGNTAVIGTAGANIYYHWMIDILPRLAMVAKMISWDKVDHFITGFTQLPFQTETLSRLNIPVDKIIASNENWNFHIKADYLFVPSLAGPLDQPQPLQVDFLRSLFKDSISTQPPFRMLYISRKKTGRRAIVNEDELIACLSKHHFEVIDCEEMSVAEQAGLFSEAAIIIGSHGSAFTNLVFCNPGTTVIDIFNDSHINPCFWLISKLVNLNYHFMSGISKPIDNNLKNDCTIVDILEFKKLLNKIGLPE
jgi:capsular polysaccharide biosynthesis protein